MDTLEIIARAAKRAPNPANARSVVVALDRHGRQFGLDQPHRLAQYLAQLMHESAEFRYDREIWGPTPAQKRYDTRADLGNTPERDGDGELYKGRAGIQITGRANYRAFTDWCRRRKLNPPDFVADPDKVNTDPWEGLAPLWYWDSGNPTGKSLNRYADQGDVENITLKINGGRNGLSDRLDYVTRVSLVMLGHGPKDIGAFQAKAGLVVDGADGPKTRAALHQALVALTSRAERSGEVKAAPVVEEKPVAVAPEAIDRPVTQTSGFWERLGTIGASLSGLGALVFGDWRVTAAALGGVAVLAVVGLVFHARIIAAVRAIKAEVAS